ASRCLGRAAAAGRPAEEEVAAWAGARRSSPRLGKSRVARSTRSVEGVVGVERDDATLRRHEMNAGALDIGQAEIEAVEELHDGDPEDVLVTRTLRHRYIGQAA